LAGEEEPTVTIDSGTPSLLEDQALDYLRQRGEEVEFAEGETVLRQGETGAAFWVILRGEVEVVLRSHDDSDHSLLRLGPGETFGELAILRSAPIAADVVAVTPLTLLKYPSVNRFVDRCSHGWPTASFGEPPKLWGSTSRPARWPISTRGRYRPIR
jgi:CRP-like cAMP-binding protein